MNSLVTQNGAGPVALVPDASNPFLAYGNAATMQRLIGDMLKFSKGEFTAGLDSREIPVGTRFAANMDSLMVGWLLWIDNKPADQHMGLVVNGFTPPPRRELGYLDKELWEKDDNGQPQDPWQSSNSLVLKDGDNQLYTFVTASTGGRGAIGELCKVYGKEMRQRPDMFPVIELQTGKYKHSNPRFGWIKFPKFNVVKWVPKDIFADDPPTDGDPTGEMSDEEAMEQAAQAALPMSDAAEQLANAVAGGRFNQQQPGPDQAAAPKRRGRPPKEAAPAAEAVNSPATSSVTSRDAFGRPAAAPASTGNTPRF